MLQRIPTGCKSVDKFLGGGIPSANVALIYGEAETGKTTFAMQCTVNCARHGYKALFIDCDRTFSTRRLGHIASEGEKDQVAEMIIVMRPENFDEQTTAVDNLEDYVTKSFGIVVVDTITSLYRLRIAESPSKTFDFNREINRQLALLAQIAKTRKIAVLVTSQVHSVLNEFPIIVEPVATRVLKFWADFVFALKPAETPQTITLAVEKTPAKSPAMTFDLKIGETGIHDLSDFKKR